MDEVGIAIREERIKELELTNRQLQEQIDDLHNQMQGQKDQVDEAQRLSSENYSTIVGQRNERIIELERENVALLKREATALAFARTKQDQYDEMCNKAAATA